MPPALPQAEQAAASAATEQHAATDKQAMPPPPAVPQAEQAAASAATAQHAAADTQAMAVEVTPMEDSLTSNFGTSDVGDFRDLAFSPVSVAIGAQLLF